MVLNCKIGIKIPDLQTPLDRGTIQVFKKLPFYIKLNSFRILYLSDNIEYTSPIILRANSVS